MPLRRLIKHLMLCCLTAILSLKNAVTTGLFINQEATQVKYNSNHKDDTRKPVRGALDRNKRKKTEDRTPLTKSDAKGGEAV